MLLVVTCFCYFNNKESLPSDLIVSHYYVYDGMETVFELIIGCISLSDIQLLITVLRITVTDIKLVYSVRP
jgi:hypothetical protein